MRKVDALQVPVPHLDGGLRFYRDSLGHELIWRTETAAGLRMPDTDAELVLQTERPELEANFLVGSADEAARAFESAGGRVSVLPFDIAIGRCVVVEDPWRNRLVLLDTSKGLLATDAEGNVLGNIPQTGLDRLAEAPNLDVDAQPGVVRSRLDAAIGRLLERDVHLLRCNVSERSITHKLGCYLEEQFPGWDVDCEYNRNHDVRKTLGLPPKDGTSDEPEEQSVFPDVIVHRRGRNDRNLLVIEVKKTGRDEPYDDWDRDKLRAFKNPSELGYRYGYFLKLRTGAVRGGRIEDLVEIGDYDRDHQL